MCVGEEGWAESVREKTVVWMEEFRRPEFQVWLFLSGETKQITWDL